MNFDQQSRVLSRHLVHRAHGDFSNHFLVKKGASWAIKYSKSYGKPGAGNFPRTAR